MGRLRINHRRTNWPMRIARNRPASWCYPLALWLSCWTIALSITSTEAAYAQSDLLMDELIREGIRFGDATTVQLAKPSFTRNDDEDTQAVLESLSQPFGTERFMRDSVYAPVKVDLEYLRDESGERIGHAIHTAFVIHASLDTLRDEELMQAVFGKQADDEGSGGGTMKAIEVPAEVLAELELSQSSDFASDGATDSLGNDSPRDSSRTFRYVELPLLNRVVLRGTLVAEVVISGQSLRMAWQLDPRFKQLDQWRPTWTKVERNELGQPVESEPQDYQGLAGYLVVSKVSQADSPLLVESRMVMHEPKEWFAGSAFLRSKLPQVFQENAQSFRRRLAK